MITSIRCLFGRHDYKIEHYKGIYDGQVPYLVCSGCKKEIYRFTNPVKNGKIIDKTLSIA